MRHILEMIFHACIQLQVKVLKFASFKIRISFHYFYKLFIHVIDFVC